MYWNYVGVTEFPVHCFKLYNKKSVLNFVFLRDVQQVCVCVCVCLCVCVCVCVCACVSTGISNSSLEHVCIRRPDNWEKSVPLIFMSTKIMSCFNHLYN
jgi:hypothetical protein